MNGSKCPTEEFALYPGSKGKLTKTWEEHDVIQICILEMSARPHRVSPGGQRWVGGGKTKAGPPVRRCLRPSRCHVLETGWDSGRNQREEAPDQPLIPQISICMWMLFSFLPTSEHRSRSLKESPGFLAHSIHPQVTGTGCPREGAVKSQGEISTK